MKPSLTTENIEQWAKERGGELKKELDKHDFNVLSGNFKCKCNGSKRCSHHALLEQLEVDLGIKK